MRSLKFIVISICLLLSITSIASETADNKPPFGKRIAESPFVELYVLEELKQLRSDMANYRHHHLLFLFNRCGQLSAGIGRLDIDTRHQRTNPLRR